MALGLAETRRVSRAPDPRRKGSLHSERQVRWWWAGRQPWRHQELSDRLVRIKGEAPGTGSQLDQPPGPITRDPEVHSLRNKADPTRRTH